MKKSIVLLALLVSLTVSAQTQFGYVSYKDILSALPEYTVAQKDLQTLKEKYEGEINRSEREFNKKYAEFIDEQENLPKNILIKRHKELQELMEKSIAFKNEIKGYLAEAQKEMMEPLEKKIHEAVQAICLEKQYAYILNTDEKTYLFINEANGVDITTLLKERLGISTEKKELKQ